MTVPALIVAAPASASGKTTFTLGLLRHMRNAGRRVGSFKVGPDYIDPAFHAAASGRACVNLDPWAMRTAMLDHLIARAARDSDLVIGEGVMGLFDGASDGSGSTADLAARFGIPVLLVIDVRGQGASAAALAHGFASFRDDVEIAGIVLNRVGSESHVQMITDACEAVDIPVVGAVPRDEALALPDRHLGLVQAGERADLEAFLDRAAAIVGAAIDEDTISTIARPFRTITGEPAAPIMPFGQRLAVARDTAFAFAYPHLLEAWRANGAEILPFSPLANEAPDVGADAVFLPGGYPELHVERLAANTTFLTGLRDAAARGAVLYGECGGYMVLGESLTDARGAHHAMAGLLPVETSFAKRKLSLGYRSVRTARSGFLGPAGTAFRGHEFHYATVNREEAENRLFECADARGGAVGPSGHVRGSVAGSFVHLIDGVA
jgi:cobyrinic acid a,c-diamide synthase